VISKLIYTVKYRSGCVYMYRGERYLKKKEGLCAGEKSSEIDNKEG
jgi:hypothetical protein